MRIQNKGFTLLEILLVIAAIGILAAIVLVAINPTKQIESARSAQRKSEINSITKAIQQYSIDNNGQYPAGIETGAKPICNTGSQKSTDTLSPTTLCDNKTDLRVLVPTYIASIPQSDSNNYYVRRSNNNNIEVSHPRDSIWNIGGTPSLDLNFAKNKSLIDGVSGNNLISFARNSTGTYIGEDGLIKTAAANEARFDHNPTTGESLGLLVEEARTNLLTYSEQFDNASWTKTGLLAFGSGSTLNATVAPDGQTTADLLTENSSTSEHRVETAAISWVANTTYTLTIFAKANGRTRMDVFGVGGGNFTGGRNASFNLSTGAVIATDGVVASIEARANAWYRIRMTFTASAAPSASQLFIRFLDNSNNFSYTGDGTSGIFLWGAQLEAGAFPTSYILTTTAAVTRSADVASITGSAFTSFYNQTEGTVFADFLRTYSGNFPNFPNVYQFNDGTNNNEITLFGNSGGQFMQPSIAVGGSAQIDFTGFTSTFPGPNRSAHGFSLNNSTFAANGVLGTPDISVNLPTVNQVKFGDRSGQRFTGHYKRLTYWPTRLPNATLQSITQ
jgi:prepilin-type N-terminal cleavage/methylation domain-containing protein